MPLPEELKSCIEISKKNNPDLIIAQLEYEQSKKDTISARSDLAPSATLSFDRSKLMILSSTMMKEKKILLKQQLHGLFFWW